MKILITGAHGFLGKSLIENFIQRNSLMYQNPQIYGYGEQLEIISKSRQQLDLTDKKQVDEFFASNTVDVVLNTSALGGKRKIVDSPDIVYDNILMFENLLRHRDKFMFMINFGTGAELDRDEYFEEAIEDVVINKLPKDYYGFSKNIMAKRIIHLNSNVHNFRIFSVFGELETPDRFIKANIFNYKDKKPMVIHQNRYFDFFYIQDIIQVICYYIDNYTNELPKTLNMSYKNKVSLLDVANIINTLGPHQVPIVVEKDPMGPSYTGSSKLLSSLDINFLGLESGIKQMYLNL